jgi:hypothetical protein
MNAYLLLALLVETCGASLTPSTPLTLGTTSIRKIDNGISPTPSNNKCLFLYFSQLKSKSNHVYCINGAIPETPQPAPALINNDDNTGKKIAAQFKPMKHLKSIIQSTDKNMDQLNQTAFKSIDAADADGTQLSFEAVHLDVCQCKLPWFSDGSNTTDMCLTLNHGTVIVGLYLERSLKRNHLKEAYNEKNMKFMKSRDLNVSFVDCNKIECLITFESWKNILDMNDDVNWITFTDDGKVLELLFATLMAVFVAFMGMYYCYILKKPRLNKETKRENKKSKKIQSYGRLNALFLRGPLVLIVLCSKFLGAESYAKMPNGCSGVSGHLRTCYPRKAVDDYFQDYRDPSSGVVVTKLEFNALYSRKRGCFNNCWVPTAQPYTAGTKAEVLETYGPIEEWDMSEVTDISYLFWKKETVNADLSKWDVSQVTSMSNSK